MDRRTFTAGRVAGTLSLVLALAGCARGPQAYLIGAAGPQTVGYGVQNQRGIELAIDEINRAGGIDGRPLKLVTADDHATGADAARVADNFVANSSVLAVVGHVTSASEIAAARVYDGGHLPAVATTPSSPDLTGISPWVFRVITSDSANGVTLARFASTLSDSLHRPVRAGVLYHNDAYGRGLTDAFLNSFKGIVLNTDPVGLDTDLEPYVAYFKAQHPDIVFIASDEDLGLRFLREARRQHLEARFLGGDGWQGITSDSVSDGAYVGTPFTSESDAPAARRFVAAYRARFGVSPNAQAALAYDATRVIAQAIERAHSHGRVTRASVREALASFSRADALAGASGPVWFATSNDRLGETFAVARAQDGLLVPVSVQ